MRFGSHRILIGLTVAITFLAASGSSVPATAPVSPEAIASLRAAALGDDFDKSMTAVRDLSAAGSPAAGELSDVVRQLLARDAATIESEAPAISALLPKLRQDEAEFAPLRAAALAAIENLTSDPESLKGARRIFARLSNTHAKLTPVYARQLQVIQALSRRAACAELVPAAVAAADTRRLAKLAGQALAISPDAAAKFLTGPLDPPVDPAGRELLFYVACRRIEAWTHLRRVDSYREFLGLLPFELDVRLVQAARRHSKEMMDLWYFSHYSPTESERSPFGRMERAGYRNGSNENITMGSWTGEDAFQQFFNSPEHHRAWVGPEDTAMGVGKWENAWTEDIGSGPRLMTATDAERNAAALVGVELKPQFTERTRQHPRDLATIKFYDESGQEVKQPREVKQKISTREAQ
jgi:hypothetical protein